MTKQTQLSIFQQGEDLPLFSQEPDEGPSCPDCGARLPRARFGVPPTCYRCEPTDEEPDRDEHAQLRQWMDDPSSIAWCDVCSAEVRPGAQLCRSCLQERVDELDRARAAGGITFTEYQTQVAELLTKAGLNRCTECGEPVRLAISGELIHAECLRERNIREGFEVADWGDGSISPDEEQRRAALDHRGQP